MWPTDGPGRARPTSGHARCIDRDPCARHGVSVSVVQSSPVSYPAEHGDCCIVTLRVRHVTPRHAPPRTLGRRFPSFAQRTTATNRSVRLRDDDAASAGKRSQIGASLEGGVKGLLHRFWLRLLSKGHLHEVVIKDRHSDRNKRGSVFNLGYANILRGM
jgi:hypothetical protein